MNIQMRHGFGRRNNVLTFTPGGLTIAFDMTSGAAIIGAALLGVHVECRWVFSTRRYKAYRASQEQSLQDVIDRMVRLETEAEAGEERRGSIMH